MQSHERLRESSVTPPGCPGRREGLSLLARFTTSWGQALTALKMDVHWLRHRLPEEKQSLIGQDQCHIKAHRQNCSISEEGFMQN